MAKQSAEINKKLLDRLRRLFAMMGSTNVSERETARQKIDELLTKYRKNWNDLVELLQAGGDTTEWQAAWDDARSAEQHAGDAIKAGLPAEALKDPPNVLQLVHHIFEKRNGMQPHELIAATLWALHSHVFRSFDITPQILRHHAAAGIHIAGTWLWQDNGAART